MRWVATYTHVFCARRRAAGFVSHMVYTRSDCVDTSDDTVRLNYASRFVGVIYSKHIVSIKLGTVTPLRRCGLAVHEREDGPASMAIRTRPGVASWRCCPHSMLPGGATRTRSGAAICASPSGAARTVVCQAL